MGALTHASSWRWAVAASVLMCALGQSQVHGQKIHSAGGRFQGSFQPLQEGCSINVFMAWTTNAEDFTLRYRRSLESVFKSMPTACVMWLSYTHKQDDFTMFTDAGYRVQVANMEEVLAEAVVGTPLEEWYKKWDVYKTEKFIYSNVTNALRMLLLYKYGGLYLDTDIIVLKPMYNVVNAVGIEKGTLKNPITMNGAVLSFESGSPVVWIMMEEFVRKYNGNIWGNNGPRVITFAVNKWRTEKPPTDPGLNLLNRNAFYPLNLMNIGNWFTFQRRTPKDHQKMMRYLSTHSICVHFWNRASAEHTATPGTVMESLFNDYCVFCEETAE